MAITEHKINDLIGSLSRSEHPEIKEFITGILKREREELRKSATAWTEAHDKNPIPEIREQMEYFNDLVLTIDKVLNKDAKQ